MAAPRSFAAAPVALVPARAEVGTASPAYGELLAGGVDGAGAPSAEVVIYNAYTHDLQVGVAAAARAARRPERVRRRRGRGLLFGGRDAGGAATASFWRYDTAVAPAGQVTALASADALARARAPRPRRSARTARS